MSKTEVVAEKLGVCPENVSLYKGVYTVRKGFFYRNGFTSDKLAAKVSAAFPSATIVEHDEIWKPFKGGASLKNQSHWYVKFALDQVTV